MAHDTHKQRCGKKNGKTDAISHSAPTERFVCCIWYDGRLFLKKSIRSVDGKRIKVLSPGCWNTGRGPDFMGGVFRINKGRMICGDVEIHRMRGDWKAHAHQKDPAFHDVRFHVFLLNDGTNGKCLSYSGNSITEICLSDQIRNNAKRLLTKIDPSLYPYRAFSPRGRCSSILARWRQTDILEFMRSAGEARLAEKALGIAGSAETVGEEQTLYRAFLESLGYSHCKVPFIRLSEILPWKLLRRIAVGFGAGGRCKAVEAALMGMAGLIPDETGENWDLETSRYWKTTRRLWKKVRAGWELKPMDSASWNGWGSRPANNPCRRIAAVSPLLARASKRGLVKTIFPDGAPENHQALKRQLSEIFARPENSYWKRRYVWGGKRLVNPVALMGSSRTIKVIANVLLPFTYYKGNGSAAISLFRRLPAVENNSVTKLMMTRLFGEMIHLPRSWGMAAQQGLIHIFKTFCCRDRSGCRKCPLPELQKIFIK